MDRHGARGAFGQSELSALSNRLSPASCSGASLFHPSKVFPLLAMHPIDSHGSLPSQHASLATVASHRDKLA